MEFNERLITQLTRIADSLEKLNEDKRIIKPDSPEQHLINVAEELAQFEPALARLLLQYVK